MYELSFTLSGESEVKSMELEHISQLFHTIANRREFCIDECRPEAHMLGITIYTCKSVSILTDVDDGTIPLEVLKRVYCRLVKIWLEARIRDEFIYAVDIMTIAIEAIERASRLSTIKDCISHLLNIANNSSGCKHMCSTINSKRGDGNCIFLLGDVNTFCNFDAIGVVECFDSLVVNYEGRDNETIFIDMNNTYIACNGDLSYNGSDVECRSVYNMVKSTYRTYIDKWCSIKCREYFSKSILRQSCIDIANCSTICEMRIVLAALMEQLDTDKKAILFYSRRRNSSIRYSSGSSE